MGLDEPSFAEYEGNGTWRAKGYVRLPMVGLELENIGQTWYALSVSFLCSFTD